MNSAIQARDFVRAIPSLEAIFAFVGGTLAGWGVKEAIVPSILLAVEELFTNMVKYNRSDRDAITITLRKEETQLRVTLSDQTDKPFDARAALGADTTLPLQRRRVGGLGLHLVRKVVDDLRYEYSDGESRVTFVKQLE